MTYVSTSRDVGRFVGVVAFLIVMLVRATDTPAQPPPDCVARGTFVFTLAEGFGQLELRADGSAEMLLGSHELCAQCSFLPRVLRGTYRAPRGPDGQCLFQLSLVDPLRQPSNVDIEGWVAFQGTVLMFGIATVPGLGAGLALRTDTLIQPLPAANSSTPPQ